MNILKFTVFILMFASLANAKEDVTLEAKINYEEKMNLEMCGSLNHRFESGSHVCVYCAHGLQYDPTVAQCKGTPNVIGKCIGNHHYHAKTQECMYCVKGYKFDEDKRKCIEE